MNTPTTIHKLGAAAAHLANAQYAAEQTAQLLRGLQAKDYTNKRRNQLEGLMVLHTRIATLLSELHDEAYILTIENPKVTP